MRLPRLALLIASLGIATALCHFGGGESARAQQPAPFTGKLPPELIEKVKVGRKLQEKLHAPKCQNKKCQETYAELKQLLEDYYEQQFEDSEKAHDDAKAMENGPEKDAAAAAATKTGTAARGGLQTVDPGGKEEARKQKHADHVSKDPDNGKLDKLAQKIAKLIDDLKKCHDKCPPPTETAETPAQPATPQEPTTPTQPETPLIPATGRPLPKLSDIKLPTVPPGECWKEGEKEKYEKEAGEASKKIQEDIKYIRSDIIDVLTPRGTTTPQTLSPEAQKELDAANAAIKALQKLSGELDELNEKADKKKDYCPPPKEMKSVSPGIPGQEGSYVPRQPTGTVLVSTDGTIWCIYGDGRGNYVVLVPTR